MIVLVIVVILFIIVIVVFIVIVFIVVIAIKVVEVVYVSPTSALPHLVHLSGFNLQSLIVLIEIQPTLQIFHVLLVLLHQTLLELLEGYQKLLVVFTHLLNDLVGYLGDQVIFVQVFMASLLDVHDALVLLDSAFVEEVVFLVAEGIHIVY